MTMLSAKFGEDWPDYLPAAVFCYNASTNDATGFTPHELIYGGRKPELLHAVNLACAPGPVGTENVTDYHKEAAMKLKTAYALVRIQQERLAAANRAMIQSKRGPGQRRRAVYTKGDHVLYWEPVQPKTMQTQAQLLQGVQVVYAPQKWSDRWSGPHVVLGRRKVETGHRYKFYHKERGKELETHPNKLCAYQPWSLGLGSTSWDIDSKRLYKTGEWVPTDSLVVVPMREPCPFGIAKVLDCKPDGELTLQWLANHEENPNGMFKLGWTTPEKFAPYFAAKPHHATHVPYTTAAEGFTLNQNDVIMHGFALTGKDHLPAPLLRAIARHPYVWWDPYTPAPPPPVAAALPDSAPVVSPTEAAAAAVAAASAAAAAAIAAAVAPDEPA